MRSMCLVLMCLMSWMLLAACGSGGGDPARCAQLTTDLQSVVSSNRTCSADTDCRWLNDGCLGMCATYINDDGAAEARAIVDEATAAGCNSGCPCSVPPRPICNRGRCEGRTP